MITHIRKWTTIGLGEFAMNDVAQEIQEHIETGTYKPGEFIPEQTQLMASYNCDLETLEDALADLVYEGLLERDPLNRSQLRVVRVPLWGLVGGNHSLTKEAKRRGAEPGVKILRYKTMKAWPIVRERLQLEEGDEVTIMERLRSSDGVPISLEYSYYPTKLYPGMTENMFTGSGDKQSSFKIMQEKFNLIPVKAVDEVTVAAIEAREAKLLRLDEGTPVLIRFRLTISDKDIPIKGSRAIYRFKAGYELPI
jgi:GntR family transcriptional regulator